MSGRSRSSLTNQQVNTLKDQLKGIYESGPGAKPSLSATSSEKLDSYEVSINKTKLGEMKKQLELQRAYQDAQEELAKANEQEISKVVGEIQSVVKEVAKERNLRFVFEKDRQTVLYASDRIDISADVVKILDKKKVAL